MTGTVAGAEAASRADNARINPTRLWDLLMELAAIGATPKGGVKRLTLTDVDKAGRDRFTTLCEAEGLTVTVDAIGNMFARRPGRDPSRLPVMFGSHLDSQPSGGKFDGALGVLAGLELIRTLNEAGIETEAPLVLCNWTDEEGSRFGHSLMGSGVWAGVYPLAKAYGLADAEGITVEQAIDSIGYRGTQKAETFPADAFFELHIEQGPVLEAEERSIGIVTGAQAQVWYDAVMTGRDSHAGTTPPSARRDALVGTARVIALVDSMMRARGEAGRGTVGQLRVLPNSRNVIPGEVQFSVEFRHPDDAELARMADEFSADAAAIATENGLTLSLKELFRIKAQPFDADCVRLVEQAAARHGFAARELVSGAGHDAVYVARSVPTAMIFIPCKDGLSHNEEESILPEHAAAGAQVLCDAVLARANRSLA